MLARVNGTQLYVDVDGPQLRGERGKLVERPTLVVLHGGPGFDQGYLRPGLGDLRDHAQVVFVDLRGQGRSGRPPIDSCTLEQMADDVAAVSAVLGLDDPVVFGHSARIRGAAPRLAAPGGRPSPRALRYQSHL